MSSNVNATKKLTLVSLILMIFTSVYGFNNIPRSFYKMGYAAIPWYIISAIAFFVPFALMTAEFGAAFKNEKGGIYSWMEKSVGPKFAFIGTFMWFASYVIWMVNVSSGIWVPISNAIFGMDKTKDWAFLGIQGLTGPKTLGIMGIIWFVFVTFVSTKGLDKIKKITSVGGTAVVVVNVIVWIGAVILVIVNGGFAQPIEGLKSFTTTPNPKYAGSMISSLAFVVYALFAYGGIEAVGGLVDQTDKPEKTFPKGVMIAAAVIAVGYSFGILCIGAFTNWSNVMSVKGVTLGNASYIVMSNLGVAFGQAFGASQATSIVMGQWVARFFGLSMFLALTGAFFTLTYAPLKQLIDGTPKELWPGKLGETRKEDGMPVNAMWVQCAMVVVMIFLTSVLGGKSMAKFWDILVNMTNVAMTIPYMFLSIAFISFKKRTEIEKPFEVYKTYKTALIWGVIVTLTVGFANFFSIIEPVISANMAQAVGSDLVDAWTNTISQIVGPILFGTIAVLMYNRYSKIKKNGKVEKSA